MTYRVVSSSVMSAHSSGRFFGRFLVLPDHASQRLKSTPLVSRAFAFRGSIISILGIASMLVEISPTFAAGTPDTDLPTIIPFELLDNRVFLPLSVNGRGPYVFILDTGAGDGSSMSLTLFKLLSLICSESSGRD